MIADRPTMPWNLISEIRAALDRAAGSTPEDVLLAARIMKITEEAGEVVAAWIAWMQLNPRKAPGTRDAILDEIRDVIITAMVALATFDENPADGFLLHLEHVHQRTLDASRREVTMRGDFYEEDESPEVVRGAFDAGPHGITAPPESGLRITTSDNITFIRNEP